MKDCFRTLFSKEPIEIIDGDYYFNTDKNGDNFDESDVDRWLNKGVFKRRWERAEQKDNLFAVFTSDILDVFSKAPAPFLGIACGPGMGLTPLILSQCIHKPPALCQMHLLC